MFSTMTFVINYFAYYSQNVWKTWNLDLKRKYMEISYCWLSFLDKPISACVLKIK